MNFIIRLTLIIITALAFTPSYAASVSEESIVSLIDKMDKAFIDQDIDTIEKLISNDVYISVSITMNTEMQSISMNKAQYLDNIKKSWKEFDEYSFQREAVDIMTYQEKAIITGTVIERMRHGVDVITSNTNGTMIVELINGSLLVTSITGDAAAKITSEAYNPEVHQGTETEKSAATAHEDTEIVRPYMGRGR